MSVASPSLTSLSREGRFLVLGVAFVGWLCCGVHMSITQLAGRPAALDLLDRTGSIDKERFQELNRQAQRKVPEAPEAPPAPPAPPMAGSDRSYLDAGRSLVARWFAWFQCSFLFGAAAGGWFFGRLGDRFGRSKAMAASILTYSALAAATALAQSPLQLCALWFLACTGVGGMWPNGVALVSEVWSHMSRPAIAGLIGTAANIGIFLMATVADLFPITPNDWRWSMLAGGSPLAIGILALGLVPESPRWLAARTATTTAAGPSQDSVFQGPLLKVTLIAILLATIPMIGGWGTANWMNPWADEAGDATLKAKVGQARAFTGIVGSLLGGWIASRVGRRRTYFLVSVASLAIAQYVFWFLYPTDPSFLAWVGALGFVSGIYFGWLPYCLPEMFPTRVRSTGAGVGFNFGRIVTAVTIFATGALVPLFGGDYPRIGRLTSLLFLFGIVGIWLAPETSERQLDE